MQDTVDALEYVRQLFAAGCIQSGFFHRFACTVHSPVGRNPQDYGIKLVPLPPVSFAKNDIRFIDPTGVDHDELGRALTAMERLRVAADSALKMARPAAFGRQPTEPLTSYRGSGSGWVDLAAPTGFEPVPPP